MNINELLQTCCSSDEGRIGQIGKPFSLGKFTYATDGRILVEVPRLPDVPENELAPKKVDAVIRQFRGKPSDDLPPLPPVKVVQCDDCDNGLVTDCSCPECNGHECETCDGTGKIKVEQTMTIGERLLNTALLRKISQFPNVKINPIGAWDEPMSFVFDGGRGIVMPMRPSGVVK